MYDSVKIFRSLNDNGTGCNLKCVQRHMAVQELRSIVVKKYRYQTNYGAIPDNKENILKRDFTAETIHRKL